MNIKEIEKQLEILKEVSKKLGKELESGGDTPHAINVQEIESLIGNIQDILKSDASQGTKDFVKNLPGTHSYKDGSPWLTIREDVLAKYIDYLEVYDDLEEAGRAWIRPQLDKSYEAYGEVKMMELTHFDGYAMLDAIEFGAKWKHEQMMKNAIEGEWWRCAIVLPAKYMNTDDIRSVKIIIIENN